MSIYVLKDFIEVCKVLDIEPTWDRLHKWKNQMYKKYD